MSKKLIKSQTRFLKVLSKNVGSDRNIRKINKTGICKRRLKDSEKNFNDKQSLKTSPDSNCNDDSVYNFGCYFAADKTDNEPGFNKEKNVLNENKNCMTIHQSFNESVTTSLASDDLHIQHDEKAYRKPQRFSNQRTLKTQEIKNEMEEMKNSYKKYAKKIIAVVENAAKKSVKLVNKLGPSATQSFLDFSAEMKISASKLKKNEMKFKNGDQDFELKKEAVADSPLVSQSPSVFHTIDDIMPLSET